MLFVVGTSRIPRPTTRGSRRSAVGRSRHRLVDGGTAPQFLPTGHFAQRAGRTAHRRPVRSRPLAVRGAPVTSPTASRICRRAASAITPRVRGGALLHAARPADRRDRGARRQGHAAKLADAPYVITAAGVPGRPAVAVDPDGATQQIAIIDLARNTTQRVTYEWDNAESASGPRTARVSCSGPMPAAATAFVPAGGGRQRRRRTAQTTRRDEIPTPINGRLIAYEDPRPVTRNDLWVMSLDDRKPQVLVRTPFDETGARFSPDGRWIAYQSNQSGAWEVYLQAYPGHSGDVMQVSQGGGVRGRWQPDGRSLRPLSKDEDVMSVAISSSGPGTPVKLFALEPNDLMMDVMQTAGCLSRSVARRRQTPPHLTSSSIGSSRCAGAQEGKTGHKQRQKAKGRNSRPSLRASNPGSPSLQPPSLQASKPC